MAGLRLVSLATLVVLSGALAAGCRERSSGEAAPAPTATPPPSSTPHPLAAASVAADSRSPSERVRIAFTAKDPHAGCHVDDCSTVPLVSIRPARSAAPLALSPGRCPTWCETCKPPACPAAPCPRMAVGVPSAELDWDGTWYEPGTCEGGAACVARRRAPPGRYVAELCVARGERTNDSIGVPVCIESGERACAAIEFAFPGTREVAGVF